MFHIISQEENIHHAVTDKSLEDGKADWEAGGSTYRDDSNCVLTKDTNWWVHIKVENSVCAYFEEKVSVWTRSDRNVRAWMMSTLGR